jgi:protein O-mannosyl-transferase
VVPAVVLLVTAAVYLPALGFGFVLDDWTQIVLSHARFTWHSIPGYFTTDVWSYILQFKSNYYRPVFMLWLMLNYQLFGLETVPWHASMIVAHMAVTLMVYFLAQRLTGNRMVAGTAGLLFGVHPVHVEAVAWLSGSTETLFAMLGLGTILCHLRWRDPLSTRRMAWRAGEIGLFALAMFAKETAIVIPLVLCGWEWFFPAAPFTSRKKRISAAVTPVLPHLGVIFIYFLARYHSLGRFTPSPQHWTIPAIISTWPFALSFYLRQLLIPIQYSLFYPIAPVTHFTMREVGIPLAAVLAAAGALVWISRRSPVRAFCALLLVLPIVPVLNLRAFASDDFLHDRYVYVCSAGLCILVALGLERLIRRAPLRAGVLLVLVGILALVNIQSSLYWNDNLSLYRHAAEVAPESAVAAQYLTAELVNQQQWADAVPILSNALLHDPGSAVTLFRIAICYVALGEVDKGISFFDEGIAREPNSPGAYHDLAMVEFSRDLLPQAEEHLRQALRLRTSNSPLFASYHSSLGRILEGEEKWSDALAEYQAELREDPSSERALDGLERMQKRIR